MLETAPPLPMVIKSQSFLSYWPFVASSHSQFWSNLRLRMMRLLQPLGLKLQCLIVEPLAEKMVSPPLGLMFSKLMPVTRSTGCSCGGLCALKGVLARFCTVEPISFHPRLRSFMISMTFTEPAVLFAARTALAKSSGVKTCRYARSFVAMTPPPVVVRAKPVRLYAVFGTMTDVVTVSWAGSLGVTPTLFEAVA